MNITRVVIRPVEMNKVKAMASITIDDAFVVHGLRVVEGERGFFVAMPSRRLPSGEYRDVAHPINTETREMIEKMVLEEYEKFKEAPQEKPLLKEEAPVVEEEKGTTEAEKEAEVGAAEPEEKAETETISELPETKKEEAESSASEEPEEKVEEPEEESTKEKKE